MYRNCEVSLANAAGSTPPWCSRLSLARALSFSRSQPAFATPMIGTFRCPRRIIACSEGKIFLYARSPVAPKKTSASEREPCMETSSGTGAHRRPVPNVPTAYTLPRRAGRVFRTARLMPFLSAVGYDGGHKVVLRPSDGPPGFVGSGSETHPPPTAVPFRMSGGVMSPRVQSWLGTVVLVAGLAMTSLAADDGDKSSTKPPPGKAGRDPALVEVRFTDNSTMKLSLREERIEVATRYGKLVVPVAEIQRIEFGTRLSEEDGQKIEAAINNLGSPQYKVREAAHADLVAFHEKAYPALLRATKHKDPEVIRRAEELLTHLRQTVPEDVLEIREFDVVSTAEMRMTGRIGGETFKVHTSQFGEQPLKLADIRGLRSLSKIAAETEMEPKNVIADPGSLSQYQGQIGKVLYVQVTGGMNPNMARGGFGVPGGAPIPAGGGPILMMGGGTVWGTDIYTTDSPLAL